jgi:hypothetical protein
MIIPQPPAAGPDPGQPGHFAHHEWLEDSVVALDSIATRVLSGSVVVTVTNSHTTNAVAVTFPPGTFTKTPAVSCQPYGTGYWIGSTSLLTANGVSLYASRKDSVVVASGSITLLWIAAEPFGGVIPTTDVDDPEPPPVADPANEEEGTEQ